MSIEIKQPLNALPVNTCFQSPHEEILKEAANNAAENWRTWQDDFTHHLISESGDFKNLPVFQSLPRFYGFGFDYSIFRLYERSKLNELRTFLGGIENPASHEILHKKLANWAIKNELCIIAKKGDKKGKILQSNHISLVSKLLGLWKPSKYPMWDTLARDGMKCVMTNSKVSRYDGSKVSNYENFRSDFETLAAGWAADIQRIAKVESFGGCADCSVYRTLDNYLMLLGRQKRVIKS